MDVQDKSWIPDN